MKIMINNDTKYDDERHETMNGEPSGKQEYDDIQNEHNDLRTVNMTAEDDGRVPIQRALAAEAGQALGKVDNALRRLVQRNDQLERENKRLKTELDSANATIDHLKQHKTVLLLH